MKLAMSLVMLILSMSTFAADENLNCVVNSRDEELDQFEVEKETNGAVKFYEIIQNDGSKIKFRVTVSVNKEVVVRIMNNDKKVSMGSWDTTDIVAEGVTEFSTTANIKISSGVESNTAKRIISVLCSGNEKRPSFEGRQFSLFRL